MNGFIIEIKNTLEEEGIEFKKEDDTLKLKDSNINTITLSNGCIKTDKGDVKKLKELRSKL